MEKTSNRILLFTTAFRPFIGGSEIAIEEIAKRLSAVNFDIITPRYTRKLKKLEDFGNIRIYRVGWGVLSDKFFFPIFGFLMARRLLRSNTYEIAHAYQASYGGGAAYIFKLFNPGIKLVLTLQEGKNLDRQGFWIRFLRKMVIKKADLITAISNYLKDYAKRFSKKVKIVVIPNGVDIESFSRDFSYGELSLVADSLGIKPGEKVIISVSRLVPKNGADILIRAFYILNTKHQILNTKLLLVGDGEQKEELVTLAKELGVFRNIIFAGSVSHVELPKYLKISDVFVRPSRSEGLGSAFLEAMTAGISIIGTRVGGIPDFLKDNETGIFCKMDDPEDLAVKIKKIIEDKNQTARITKNARFLVLEKHDWNLIAEKFKEIYDTN